MSKRKSNKRIKLQPDTDIEDASSGCYVSLSNQHQTQSEVASAIAQEFMCACCLDILVQPTTLTPCGHTFCNACIFQGIRSNKTKFDTCPTCREEIFGTAPNRAVNGALQAIISNPNSSSSLQFFSSDDIDDFRARAASAKPPRAMKLRAKKLVTSNQSSSVEGMNPLRPSRRQNNNRSRDGNLDMERMIRLAVENYEEAFGEIGSITFSNTDNVRQRLLDPALRRAHRANNQSNRMESNTSIVQLHTNLTGTTAPSERANTPRHARTVVNPYQRRQAEALFHSSHPDPQPQASIFDNADAPAATTRRIYNPYRQPLRTWLLPITPPDGGNYVNASHSTGQGFSSDNPISLE